MIDTHCHLDLDAFDTDRDEVVARATAAGVTGMLVPGVRPATWPALRAFAARHAAAGVRAALGIHPQVIPEIDEPIDVDDLVAACRPDDIVAVGECGLDGGMPDLPRQEAIFRAHIHAARTVGKPLVIHVLRAHDQALRVLREERVGPGVLHSYSGGADLVRPYADLGLHFSLAGAVTYPNARRPVEAARAIPADRLLAETDAPDQSPHRGQRSEPAFVSEVLAALAAARGATVEAIDQRTTTNARMLFRTW